MTSSSRHHCIWHLRGSGEIYYSVISMLMGLGLLVGIIWAEKAPNSIGLSGFWERLIALRGGRGESK